jgi:sulfur-oxidizing protein SoxY
VTARRTWLRRAGGVLAISVVPVARADAGRMAAEVERFAGGATVRAGRVRIDVPELVDNGNSVPIEVEVDAPVNAQSHVRRIAVFNEKNPQPNVAIFHLGPRAGRARVGTRIRLADSQRIVAVAELSDGSFWSAAADVIVALAACLE